MTKKKPVSGTKDWSTKSVAVFARRDLAERETLQEVK